MNTTFRKKRHTVEEYVQGLLRNDRVLLSKAITLVESKLESDIALAEQLMTAILPYTGHSVRIGITGVPGAGKSTFVESFGKYLTGMGKRVAVLSIDPTSRRTQGSILGDKTRMEELAKEPLAFIRPSPSGATLGGVHSRTREAMLLCEASGYEVVLIETVGVGQSETSVKNLVDFFLLLLIAGAGDELQGMKRGIVEMADAIAINKADGDNMKRSQLAQSEYKNALHLFPLGENGWIPQVVTCSAIEHTGISAIWEMVGAFVEKTQHNGSFDRNRQLQNLQWLHDLVRYHVYNRFYNRAGVRESLASLESDVQAGTLPAIVAAKKLLSVY